MSDRRDRERDRDRARYSFPPRHTNSNDPSLLNSRVFIGNLPTDKVDRDDLEKIFMKYGQIIAVSVLRGYGFVQFDSEEDARRAVDGEAGGLLKGSKIDVKMAAEGRKRESTGPMPSGSSAPKRPVREGRFERDPSPPRDPFRRGDPADRRDHLEDPYRRVPPPPREGFDRYDQYSRDSYPPPPPPPGDHYPTREAVPFRPPYEVELILLGSQIRPYAESIVRRLKPTGMIMEFNVLKSESELQKAIDELTRMKVPYAVILGAQNEIHRSLTLNILHGTPQEHRNMPLDDAITLMTRNFEVYVQELREKATQRETSSRKEPPEFLPPDQHTSYLLNLLADNRILTLEELDHVLGYLQKRRQKIIGTKGGRTVATVPDEKAIDVQQQKLQKQILSILNGEDGPPAVGGPGAAASMAGYGMHQGTATSNPSLSTSINFDNPSVQKALDDLIQSGPNLLRNITAMQQQPTPQQPHMALAESYSASPYGAPTGGFRPRY